jgi:hypothetical protein
MSSFRPSSSISVTILNDVGGSSGSMRRINEVGKITNFDPEYSTPGNLMLVVSSVKIQRFEIERSVESTYSDPR